MQAHGQGAWPSALDSKWKRIVDEVRWFVTAGRPVASESFAQDTWFVKTILICDSTDFMFFSQFSGIQTNVQTICYIVAKFETQKLYKHATSLTRRFIILPTCEIIVRSYAVNVRVLRVRLEDICVCEWPNKSFYLLFSSPCDLWYIFIRPDFILLL